MRLRDILRDFKYETNYFSENEHERTSLIVKKNADELRSSTSERGGNPFLIVEKLKEDNPNWKQELPRNLRYLRKTVDNLTDVIVDPAIIVFLRFSSNRPSDVTPRTSPSYFEKGESSSSKIRPVRQVFQPIRKFCEAQYQVLQKPTRFLLEFVPDSILINFKSFQAIPRYTKTLQDTPTLQDTQPSEVGQPGAA